MRRARIKALAAVPVRKKPGPVTQDVVSDDAANVSDKEQKKEDAPSADKTDHEKPKDVANTREQKEDTSVTDLPAQESSKDMTKTTEETVEKNQDEINVVERESEATLGEKQNVASPAKTSASPSKPTSPSKTSLSPKVKLASKRRIVISESARKLAEAKREFLLKHENKTPDRSQLRMYDLIYYNPVTNPMKSTTVQRQETVSQPIDAVEEEEEDDPASIPAPQVKVGPDGQLIIDEQSLVIEQTHEKKRREIMESEAIIEDENNHMGGFYKKHKRSKDWPNWETFKFYQVLNVVGTDFLLMQTLFPNRTRQEIKQKYKKEERINRHLVEKALKYHQEFDTEMLEEQLAMLKNLENIQDTSKTAPDKPVQQSRMVRKLKNRLVAESIGECEVSSANDEESGEATALATNNDGVPLIETSKIEDAQQQIKKESRARKVKEKVKKRVKKNRLVAESIGECEVSSVNDEESGEATALAANNDSVPLIETSKVEDAQQQIKKKSRTRKVKEKVKKRAKKKISTSTNNSSESSASSNADSDNYTEIYEVRPTRSGRLTKRKVKQLDS